MKPYNPHKCSVYVFTISICSPICSPVLVLLPPFFWVCMAPAARSWPVPDFFWWWHFSNRWHRAVFEIPPPSITCGRKKMGNRSVSGGCGQRFNLPPTPWVKARTGGIGPGRSAPQPLALAIGRRTGKASTGHRACKVRRAASIRARARAGTAPGQGQAVTQQGTGKAGRTGGIDPGGVAPRRWRWPSGTARARSAPARHRACKVRRAASIRARARARAGTAPGQGLGTPPPYPFRGYAYRVKQRSRVSAGWSFNPPPPHGHAAGHRQGRPHRWHQSGRGGTQHPATGEGHRAGQDTRQGTGPALATRHRHRVKGWACRFWADNSASRPGTMAKASGHTAQQRGQARQAARVASVGVGQRQAKGG
jgi:hypothetical protein